tara:strand:+ start:150 stop:395 length:246 start_codon:yes stop_codon:yes gene_type:complete
MNYYYAPSITNADGQIDPAEAQGDGSLIAATPPLGTASPQYDRDLERFVLATPEPVTIAGWDVKTAAEVNTDYPGLIPGGE